MNELTPEPPERRRRWFSIGLRALMLLILVVGGPMGWKARRASLLGLGRLERLTIELDQDQVGEIRDGLD